MSPEPSHASNLSGRRSDDDECLAQHHFQQQTADDSGILASDDRQAVPFDQLASSDEVRGEPHPRKRKRQANGIFGRTRVRLSSGQLSEAFALAIEAGGQVFKNNPIYQNTWLSDTDLVIGPRREMRLCDLDIAYETYTSSCTLLLQRARLIQCFLALATARKGGRPPSKGQTRKVPAPNGCSKTKLRRANIGRVLVELMKAVPPSRARKIGVALAGMSNQGKLLVCLLTDASCARNLRCGTLGKVFQ